ncbi:HTH-type transcriptional regulatory protein GabR [Ensifer psoraleae]|uniref:aminotransferase-like domain-containing protein n=1 Tax=Sinorhizobium psoraleae TaxID=520838 RepID=UPI0015681ABF|nr:PLP-dependent aminotransferase family protein [Sinorhizobium psoraleae]NRP70937.1 HTH-type transcriptional regulatory protein GabR [Sinorhizobium psoraleae]
MLMKSPWEPWIAPGDEPVYQRLAAAIAEDLVNAKIAPGSRLPAQRDLSYRLGVGLGTVTKAYGLLARQGLASSFHGRGVFATNKILTTRKMVDLSLNVPPSVISEKLLSGTLASLATTIDADTFRACTFPKGTLEHRMAVAGWLQRYCASVDAERMVFCNSGQHALSTVLTALVAPDLCLATDELPFPGLVRISHLLGIELVGIDADREGLLPEALERIACEVALRRKRLVLFTNPTAQNPTGKTMSQSRVKDIAVICQRQDILIIEDDVYAAFAARDRICFLDLAPERTYYINSFSKLFTPGLRLGVLIAPSHQLDNLVRVLRAQGATDSPISRLVIHKWIADGVASHISRTAGAEAVVRNKVAASIFASTSGAWVGSGFHMFLSMHHSAAVALANAARERGIMVTDPAVSLSDRNDQSGIRLCLGGPTRLELSRALREIAALHVQLGQGTKASAECLDENIYV